MLRVYFGDNDGTFGAIEIKFLMKLHLYRL